MALGCAGRRALAAVVPCLPALPHLPLLPPVVRSLSVLVLLFCVPSCSAYQKACKYGDLSATKLMEALCARPHASKALTDLLHNTKCV
jgi:hypothetical protein